MIALGHCDGDDDFAFVMDGDSPGTAHSRALGRRINNGQVVGRDRELHPNRNGNGNGNGKGNGNRAGTTGLALGDTEE